MYASWFNGLCKSYVDHKMDPDLPASELNGFKAEDFKAFEDGAKQAMEDVANNREPAIPVALQPFANSLKNRVADFFNAYAVYKERPETYHGEVTIEQFQQYEANLLKLDQAREKAKNPAQDLADLQAPEANDGYVSEEFENELKNGQDSFIPFLQRRIDAAKD